jgi:hypothetical protein
MNAEPFREGIGNPMPPRALMASRIWSQGGYAAVSGMIGPGLLDALNAEAEGARPLGERTILRISDRTEGRGGQPRPGFAVLAMWGGAPGAARFAPVDGRDQRNMWHRCVIDRSWHLSLLRV